jgi:hypothetical protein
MKTNYIAKMNLPYGIRKGTEFFSFNKENFFYLNDDKKMCPFDCEAETEFFEEIAPKLYNGAELKNAFRLNIEHSSIYHIVEYSRFIDNMWYVVIIDADKNIETVYEGQLIPVEQYYFINIEGEIEQAIAGINLKRDNWCKLSDNYFSSEEVAELAKENYLIGEEMSDN